ncbi:hypothetical protein ACFYP4_05110 [Streptomyces sp. NPDC005551]|uniref:hypothetical protein n=1 Tax=Streptomyces sp. NPDC005551 TaxID=3364725 RepID=UPI00369EF074
MSTGVIITLIVIVAAVALVAVVLKLLARRPQGGRSLQRRFGPEYDRAVARHDGDERAAERDLTERVKRHGSLRERPLEPAAREQYEARWAAAQERFVDSPREAVAEADRLLGELAGARGFPEHGRYEEQLEALSVHHAHHVHGYRRVHGAAHGGADGAAGNGTSTEEMREAMLDARALFEELVTPSRKDDVRHRADNGTSGARTAADDSETVRSGNRTHAPWTLNRRHPKGS